ncbi:hypothetical protein D7S86_23255 [Pararobbsia silviterrae]|uniref:Uncharacterized protein n=1 Tax=Pararobbsia silviterrae TaxID=1792498 RepID=A0A494XG71_9BURK|nr:hypothetical protein D7S86_23255 [Pararobbsia silviterrae]
MAIFNFRANAKHENFQDGFGWRAPRSSTRADPQYDPSRIILAQSLTDACMTVFRTSTTSKSADYSPTTTGNVGSARHSLNEPS